tara:strand:- start:1264 stop:1821 length:558 start_codon:yes stop_codon:yes gene_type:complete
MTILTRAGDLVYTIRFLKLLTTSFDKSKAFKLGIIDAKGKKLKNPKTSEEKGAYTLFHRLVYNIKKLIPGGKVGSFASALFLLKEKYGVNPERALEESGLDELDLINENSQWFMLDDKQISPGVYNILNDKMLNESHEELVKRKDKIRILDDCYPVGDVMGLDIYEAVHQRTQRKIYLTVSEISK